MRPTIRSVVRIATRLALPVVLIAGVTLPAAAENPAYVVQPGDTLWAIAQRFHVSTAEVVAANGLGNADLIFVGQQLVIPGASVAASVESGTPRPPVRTAAASSLLAGNRLVTY